MAKSTHKHPPGCPCPIHQQPRPAEPTKILTARVPASVARVVEQAGGAKAVLIDWAARQGT